MDYILLSEHQWMAPEEKAKDLVVVQSKRLAVSTVPIWCWNYREVLERCPCLVSVEILKKRVLIPLKVSFMNSIYELPSKSEGKQENC